MVENLAECAKRLKLSDKYMVLLDLVPVSTYGDYCCKQIAMVY